MFQTVTIQSLIEERVPFRPISTGWSVGKCVLCNDYKERAGFKFEDGTVIYNCWNCSTGTTYEENSGKMSKTFRKVLRASGFDDSEISTAVNTPFFNKKQEDDKVITLSKLTSVKTTTQTVKLPSGSLPIGNEEHLEYQQALVNYLVGRCVDVSKFEFLFSLEKRFKDRIIIPFYRNGNLIYWQARSIDPTEKKRYDNAPVSRDAVIFNHDQLQSYSRLPLFVTEGVFDAMMVDGVSILGSQLSEAKADLLSKTQRRLIFVIDKDKNGAHLAQEVINRGWEIAFAPNGAADINASVQRFGLSWTIFELMKSVPKDNDGANLSIKMNCR
jgi:hypothetical protein